jgi:hypothetical protein
MKFSAAFISLLFVIPLLVADVDAAAARGRGRGRKNNGAAKKATGAGAAAAAANSTAVNNSAANSTAVNNAAASNSSAAAGNNNAGGAQSSLSTYFDISIFCGDDLHVYHFQLLALDPKVIATGFENNGQQVPTAGQIASLTSSNNFINFCLTVPNLPITNGQQIKTGSCNPAPMGIIAATTNMPSAKFTSPVNGQNFEPNTAFTISMAINHLDTGNFVNAESNYYSAPQQVNGAGDIIGHTHFTVSSVGSFTSTTPEDPNTFAFFKGVNSAAVNGVVSEPVTAGLPAGIYRVCSLNTDANHTPCLVAVAQHGTLDDCTYVSFVVPMCIVLDLIHIFSSPSAVRAAVETPSRAALPTRLRLPATPRQLLLLRLPATPQQLLPLLLVMARPRPLPLLLAMARPLPLLRPQLRARLRPLPLPRPQLRARVASAPLTASPALDVTTDLWDRYESVEVDALRTVAP